MIGIHDLLSPIRELQEEVRRAVVEACERASLDDMSGIAAEEEGDTIYAIDRVSEETLVDFFSREVAPRAALVLIAEGIEGGRVVLPRGTREEARAGGSSSIRSTARAAIMYQKRSAWVLTGVAPNRGPDTRLSDIELAVQTEIPMVKQHLWDVLWAVRGRGRARRACQPAYRRAPPARAAAVGRSDDRARLRDGGAVLPRCARRARRDRRRDRVLRARTAAARQGASVRGSVHLVGRAAVRADCGSRSLRRGHPAADGRVPRAQREARSAFAVTRTISATELIARELGVIVTDAHGARSIAPLAVEPDVSWVGYANAGIRAQVEPRLQQALRRRGLL